ncbi:MAG TPA: glycosyltransferase [Candidatus Binatia bacterium]|nr:glycosyltransferase [Candidatus Binatia bacterium]
MSSARRISVVIPTFNLWFVTKRCLSNLFAHGGDALGEVIVVDNASSDETRRELANWPGVKPLLFPENRGFAVASNAGARAALCDAILFLNNDAFTLPGALEALLEALDDEGVGIVGARLFYEDGTLQHAGMAPMPNKLWWHLHWHLAGDYPDALVPRDYLSVTGAAMLMSRAAFDVLGGFDENYRNGYEDVDLCLRAWNHGIRVRYEPRATFIHLESASPGRINTEADKQNFERFQARWAGLVEQVPQFFSGFDVSPPIGIIGDITKGDVASQAARQFCRYYWLTGGVKYLPHRPLPDPVAVEVPQLADSKFHPAVIFEWGDDIPVTSGAKRVIYAAPRSAEHARAIALRDCDALWLPTEHARSLMIEAGVAPAKIEVVCVGICGQAFSPEVAPYPFATSGFRVLAFMDEYTTQETLRTMLEVVAHIEPAATLVLATPQSGPEIEGRLRGAVDQLARRGLHPTVAVASTAGLVDGMLPGFFTGCPIFLAVDGDPYGYAVLAAMASGALVAALDRPPVNEFLNAESALLSSEPIELARAIGRMGFDPEAARTMRSRARFNAARKFSAVKTACRAAALLRVLYWGPSDGSGVAVTPETAAIARAYGAPI